MHLILHYRGGLKSSRNFGLAHKHEIRRHFHSQLKTLWTQKPLSEQPELLTPGVTGSSLLRPIGSFIFAPLVNAQMNVVAELTITLLRPEPPGGLLTQGGDIDNRLKTLFDALRMPQHLNELPPGDMPADGESPFFCLLENDTLVTAVSVRTEQLLEPNVGDPEVDLTISVRTRVTRPSMENFSFA